MFLVLPDLLSREEAQRIGVAAAVRSPGPVRPGLHGVVRADEDWAERLREIHREVSEPFGFRFDPADATCNVVEPGCCLEPHEDGSHWTLIVGLLNPTPLLTTDGPVPVEVGQGTLFSGYRRPHWTDAVHEIRVTAALLYEWPEVTDG